MMAVEDELATIAEYEETSAFEGFVLSVLWDGWAHAEGWTLDVSYHAPVS